MWGIRIAHYCDRFQQDWEATSHVDDYSAREATLESRACDVGSPSLQPMAVLRE